MIQVLHVITSTSIGGAEMMLLKLTTRMHRSNWKSIALSIKPRETVAAYLESEGVPTLSLEMKNPIAFPKALWHLHRIISKVKPDLIQGWMYHGNLMALIASRFNKTRIPVVWNIRHSLYDLGLEKRTTQRVISIGALLSSKVDRIIYNAGISAKHHEIAGYAPTKTTIIPNGFDTSRFIPNAMAQRRIRSDLNVLDQTQLVGMIARYHPLKDHTTFIKAAEIIYRNEANVKFLLVGRGADHQNPELNRLISKLNLQKCVILLGERSDIPEINASLDIACLSSLSEGFPNTIGEAMSCGVPCVATNTGDTANLIGNQGRVVPPSNPMALASAVLEIIRLPAVEKRLLSQGARARIKENYNLDTIVRKYETTYDQLVK